MIYSYDIFFHRIQPTIKVVITSIILEIITPVISKGSVNKYKETIKTAGGIVLVQYNKYFGIEVIFDCVTDEIKDRGSFNASVTENNWE